MGNGLGELARVNDDVAHRKCPDQYAHTYEAGDQRPVFPHFTACNGEGDILSPESSSIPPGSSIDLNPIPSTPKNSIPLYDWIF